MLLNFGFRDRAKNTVFLSQPLQSYDQNDLIGITPRLCGTHLTAPSLTFKVYPGFNSIFQCKLLRVLNGQFPMRSTNSSALCIVHLFKWDKSRALLTPYLGSSLLSSLSWKISSWWQTANMPWLMSRLGWKDWAKKVRPTPLTFPGSRPGNTAGLMITDSFLLTKYTCYNMK